MTRDQYDEAVEMGRANLEAMELTQRHCRHARIELVHGNSLVGNAVGLPMGMLRVRCEFAPPPRWSGHKALDLAVDFYKDNCVGCAYRRPSGEVPNLATFVAELDEQEASRREAAEREAAARARRHSEREERRRVAVGREGYVIRDLAHWLDQLDGPSRRAPTGEARQAGRQLVETARHAPELFSPALVETLLGLAGDTAEPAAFLAIYELVRAQKCRPRSAVEAALSGLKVHPEPEAARLLDLFRPQLDPEDLAGVLDSLIEMASNLEEPWGSEPVLEGIRAAAAVDLPGTTTRIVTLLESSDDAMRGAAADAAGALLAEDGKRVIALGPPLIASVQGKDEGYAGMPHPATSAVKALAEAWRNEPELTMSLVEAQGGALPEEARAVLVRVVWFLERWREPWDASEAAGRTAVEFCLRRLGGDWGEQAADEASQVLDSLTRAVPHLLAERVDWLIGIILEMTRPLQASPLLAEPPRARADEQAMLDALNRTTSAITRNARLRRTAEALGSAARVAPGPVLPKLQALFESERGDEDQINEVRLAVLDSLKEAVCPDLLRDLLPLVYTALLHTQQAVRAAGIDLWAECVRAAPGELPDELAELASGLLSDSYVIVHSRMLKRLPGLRLPPRLASELIEIAAGWAQTHRSNPEILDDALWTLRHLAGKFESEPLSIAWLAVALGFAKHLSPYDRQRFLLVNWPDLLADSPGWTQAAVSALASRELADYYNMRHDPLLAKLMERPALLMPLPSDELMALSDVHDARMVWRALEPVELLQAAGRREDAAQMAERVAERQPRGMEGKHGRDLASLVAASARHNLMVAQARSSDTRIQQSLTAVREALATLLAGHDTEGGEGAAGHLLDAAKGMVLAGEALTAPISANPYEMASRLNEAASLLRNPATGRYASGAQRRLLADAWDIAAFLLRYDGAARVGQGDAASFLAAAKRGAQVLDQNAQEVSEIPAFIGPLQEFLMLVEAVNSATDVSTACLGLLSASAPLPLVGRIEREPMRGRPAQDDGEVLEDETSDLLAVCIADLSGAPVTDVLVVKPDELYRVGISAWIPWWPEWAHTCVVEPVSRLPRESLSLPRYSFARVDAEDADGGLLLHGSESLVCRVEQAINEPPVDCPLRIRFVGETKEGAVEVAGYRRLRLRPFDPARDALTEHQQTDQRLLQMFDRLTAPEFDSVDVRAFCRLFSACVRAAQGIMFDKTFRRGTAVKESEFHDELEQRLRSDSVLEGRLTRRDKVAGGFDDLLHDDVIAELKVEREKPVTVDDCARFLGQPTQYAVGRGSQLSVLVVLDHSRKDAPPGVIDNYVGWLQPRLHGLEDSAYPSLVGVLIVNTNLPVPSTWSRRSRGSTPA